MKNFLIIFAILTSLRCAAQDTTYYQMREQLYMQIRKPVTDSSLYNKWYREDIYRKQRKRKDRILTIISVGIFSTLSFWYWSK